MSIQPTQAKTSPSSLALSLAPSGPGSVSPTQFAAQASAKTATSYQQYQDYLATNMGRLDGRAITQQANSELAGMVNPVLNGYEQQRTQGTQAIGQYTNQLAGNLSGIQGNIANAYGQAEQQTSALNTAIQAELAGNGGAQAAALQATLAQAGQSTAPATAAASSAKGIAGAQYASGSASLAALIGEAAAQKAYGAQLPGIATLAGYQALGNLNSGITSAESKAVTTAQGKYPTLVNQLTSQALAGQRNNLTAANDAARLQQTGAYQAGELGIRQQTANTAATRANNEASYQQGELGLRSQANKLSAQRNSISEQRAQIDAAYKSQQLTDSEHKQAQTYSLRLKQLGIDSAKVAIDAAKTEAKIKSGGFTPLEVTRFKGNALTIAQGALSGGQYDANGAPAANGGFNAKKQPAPPLTYQAAILEMQKDGIPLSIAIPAVNRFYPPGQSGRPLTATQAAKIKGLAKVKAFGG